MLVTTFLRYIIMRISIFEILMGYFKTGSKYGKMTRSVL